jgi:hypothetical protein
MRPSGANLYRQQYADEGHVFIRKHTSDRLIERLKAAIEKAPRRRVCVNNREETWESAKFRSSDPALDFYSSVNQLKFIADCTQLPMDRFQGIAAWAHIYRMGEFIPRHRDGTGFCQLVTGVELNADANSALLHIEVKGKIFKYQLDPGDAVLFKATDLYHWTTPLRARGIADFATRCVFVVRYCVAS